MASEEEIHLYEETITKGCCKRCALRYLGQDKTLITFDYPNTSLVNFGLLSPMEEFEIEPPSKIKKSNPCTVCLGILQDSMIDEMLAHESLTKTSEYQHKTFHTYLTVPTCVLLRDHSMKLYLKKTFPHFDMDKVIKLNTAWRQATEKRLSKILKKKSDNTATFTLHFYTEYILEEDEIASVQNFLQKKSLSKHHVTNLLDSISDEQFLKLVNAPPREPFFSAEFKDVKFSSETIHMMGNYCKYSRTLPQVPFIFKGIVNDDPVDDNSIETILLKAVQQVTSGFKEMVFKASNFDYLATRILGNGRTFSLHLNDPKFETVTKQQCAEIEDIVRKSDVMEVKNLHRADKKDIVVAMDSEQMSPCSYRVLCIIYECKNVDYCVNAVNMYQTILVSQKIPLKFMHQRPLVTKHKKIYYIRAKKVRENLIELELCAENGFYVNEFISGDLGRTQPSLGDIMKACAAEEQEVVI